MEVLTRQSCRQHKPSAARSAADGNWLNDALFEDSADQASLQAAQDELAFLFLRGAAVGVCRSDFDQQFKAAHARVIM